MKHKFNSFEDLGKAMFSHSELEKEKELQKLELEKENKRRMIIKNNLKWLRYGKKDSVIVKTDDAKLFICKYAELMNTEKQGKWVLHLISNFIPLNKVLPAPILRGGGKAEYTCPITQYPLADAQSIILGRNDSRDKHIAYIGENSNVYLSGSAVYALYQFVVNALENETEHSNRISSHLDIMRLVEKKSKLNLTN